MGSPAGVVSESWTLTQSSGQGLLPPGRPAVGVGDPDSSRRDRQGVTLQEPVWGRKSNPSQSWCLGQEYGAEGREGAAPEALWPHGTQDTMPFQTQPLEPQLPRTTQTALAVHHSDLIEWKRWRLLGGQLLLRCRWCRRLWERGPGLDRGPLQSRDTRKERSGMHVMFSVQRKRRIAPPGPTGRVTLTQGLPREAGKTRLMPPAQCS